MQGAWVIVMTVLLEYLVQMWWVATWCKASTKAVMLELCSMLLPANHAIYSIYVDYDDATTHKFLAQIFEQDQNALIEQPFM